MTDEGLNYSEMTADELLRRAETQTKTTFSIAQKLERANEPQP